MKVINRAVIIYEIIGFLAVLLLLWLDEIFDLPHLLFKAPATPINLLESIFESLIVLTFAVFVVYMSWLSLKRIKLLEGFLRVCAYCKKIRTDDNKWIPFELYITQHSKILFSHTVCPECVSKHYAGKPEEKTSSNQQ